MSKTTEDLRQMLFDTIEGVKSGDVTVQQARAIGDTAQKIIDSVDIELRYALTQSNLDKQDQGITAGRVLLTQGERVVSEQ